MNERKQMACVSCGLRKDWADGFPDHTEATCWSCAFDRHIHNEHPKTVRKIKRAARKRAKRVGRREVWNAMWAEERRRAFGIVTESEDT